MHVCTAVSFHVLRHKCNRKPADISPCSKPLWRYKCNFLPETQIFSLSCENACQNANWYMDPLISTALYIYKLLCWNVPVLSWQLLKHWHFFKFDVCIAIYLNRMSNSCFCLRFTYFVNTMTTYTSSSTSKCSQFPMVVSVL